ncbi:copper resistance protein CopC [Erythrobacter sp. NFXS35]|uniref:copper resistance protein CopC n=1 Tax=Erythrobacter sp. NFXS35 TaxID=2818436 RepID=UPI0032DEA52C
MRITAFFAALALSAGVPSALLAHVELTASTPAAGTQAKAPRKIALTFSQPVVASTAAASIVMTAMPGMANHGEMVIRNFTASWSDDGQIMTLILRKPLPAGTYEVRWQAAAADGHSMSGAVGFDVG